METATSASADEAGLTTSRDSFDDWLAGGAPPTAFPDTFPDWLAHRASTMPARTALIAGGREWTYAQLDDDATRTARKLAYLGVRAGDRVATLLRNGTDAVLLAHAVPRLGATLVPLNIRLSEPEIAWQVGDALPRLLVADSVSALTAAGDLENPVKVIDPATLAGEVGEADVEMRLRHDADHVLAIIYTSGTTDRPKGAMLTVANFSWSAVGSALNLGVRDDDRWLACLPLFHVGGLSIVFRCAVYGIAAIVHEVFDPDAVNRAIDSQGVTTVSVVAVMLQRMLDARGERSYPDTLRCVLLGGGPAPRPLLERCAALRVPVVQTYGLTETASQVATLAPGDALRKPGSAGKPLYPNELRIITDDGEQAGVDVGGEIVVRGPVVMAGYAGRPDATKRAIVDGWLRTGDIGRVDAEGYLYVLDRRDDLIITGGENVYPAEVEAVLLAHSSVAEAGVIGLPDTEWGQRVVAVVRLAPRAVLPDVVDVLRKHCRSRLAGYKTPAEIRVVTDPLPRTASGKLRRSALRESIRRAEVLGRHQPADEQ